MENNKKSNCKIYTLQDWEKDKVLNIKEGCIVDCEVIYELAGSVPPIIFTNKIFQCGEASTCDFNYKLLYRTFIKNEEGNWLFVGNAREGETIPQKSIFQY